MDWVRGSAEWNGAKITTSYFMEGQDPSTIAHVKVSTDDFYTVPE